MKNFIFIVFLFLILTRSSLAQLIDSFSDGNFTSSPVWNGDTGSWQIVTDSDVSSGATNSYTLRLNHPVSESGSQYLSTQISTMSSTLGQSWSFWIGRRAQAYTTANNVEIWLYANESNLENSTVDGYAITIGDDSGGDEIRLVRMTDGSVASTIITSSSALNNGLTDIGFMIRVTRSSSGSWNLYTSTLPTTNGTGAVATALPSASNVNVSQGSGTDNTYSINDNGYFGIVAVHSSGVNARATVELDQIYFDTDDSAPLPVQLSKFSYSLSLNSIKLVWSTTTEINNYGFEIERSENNFNWDKIGFVAGNGNSNSLKEYSFIDDKLNKSGKYYYRLKQLDIDGGFEYSNVIEVDFVLVNEFQLHQNFPNPFSATGSTSDGKSGTTISWQSPVSSWQTIKLYNSLGEEIDTIVDGFYEAGKHSKLYIINSELPSGIYYYQLTANGFTQSKKMLLVR